MLGLPVVALVLALVARAEARSLRRRQQQLEGEIARLRRRLGELVRPPTPEAPPLRARQERAPTPGPPPRVPEPFAGAAGGHTAVDRTGAALR